MSSPYKRLTRHENGKVGLIDDKSYKSNNVESTVIFDAHEDNEQQLIQIAINRLSEYEDVLDDFLLGWCESSYPELESQLVKYVLKKFGIEVAEC